MKRVRYTGDPSVRVGSQLIERGGEVDVDDLTAAALCQSPSWEAVTKKKSKAKKDD
jgi:hypothetical protein